MEKIRNVPHYTTHSHATKSGTSLLQALHSNSLRTLLTTARCSTRDLCDVNDSGSRVICVHSITLRFDHKLSRFINSSLFTNNCPICKFMSVKYYFTVFSSMWKTIVSSKCVERIWPSDLLRRDLRMTVEMEYELVWLRKKPNNSCLLAAINKQYSSTKNSI